MRKINIEEIKNVVFQLALEANFVLRKDIYRALKKAYLLEDNKRARHLLKILLENAEIARKERIPICQDTGMVVVFLEIGDNVKIMGGDLSKAINEGVKKAYKEGYLRKSICEPLTRVNTGDNIPAVIHTEIVKGSKIGITLCVKGFGAENKSQIKMFEPTANWEEIEEFVLKVVKEAGPDACPPFVIGIGIGGTFEQAAILAKKATLREINHSYSRRGDKKQNTKIVQLEHRLLSAINGLRIGPMGLGGNTTALGVNILTYPTHIAGLPVAVNISCHATRSAKRTI